MKAIITPESAIDSYIKCKKEGKEISQDILDTILNYRKWHESALKGLINASGFYPDILLEPDMEENIYKILAEFKSREVERKF